MADSSEPLISAKDVTFGFSEGDDFLKSVRLDVAAGECWGIIGPNGAGKSTFLRLLAGLHAPTSGRVCLGGRSLTDVSLRERARRIAFLPQSLPTDLSNSAREIVLMGRFPHRRFGLFEDASDFVVVDEALAMTQALPYADRAMATLSGGEAQRVHIAAAIAQRPEVLLFDEPTASLDLSHQLGIFSILRELARADGVAVVVVTHDVNLAARYCSRILLLADGCTVACGSPEQVIAPNVLGPVYGVELSSVTVDGLNDRWIVPLDGPVRQTPSFSRSGGQT